MLKFTIIIAILAYAKVNAAPTEEELKTQLMFRILNAKNRAFDQVQSIKMSADTEHKNFIALVNDMVQQSERDIKKLKEEFGNAKDISCDVRNNINDAALKTIAQFQNCIEKVVGGMDEDMNSLMFNGSLLTKEIDNAENINEELREKVVDFEARSFQFAKYKQKLENCKTRSNIVRLNRQISEFLTSYKQCLQKK